LQPDRSPTSRENRQTAAAAKEVQDGHGRPEPPWRLESPFPHGTISPVHGNQNYYPLKTMFGLSAAEVRRGSAIAAEMISDLRHDRDLPMQVACFDPSFVVLLVFITGIYPLDHSKASALTKKKVALQSLQPIALPLCGIGIICLPVV
jgi:hypothetical protein